jgi:hypothetical protein
MAVNKNFVVKNGFEVNTNLIVADATADKVGIGTTIPNYQFHVIGGIGATHSFVTGVSTISNELRVGTNGQVFSVIAGPTGFGQSVGVGTAYPAYLLDVRSPVSTGQTALYVYGDLKVTGDINIDDITLDQADVNRLFVSQAAQLNGGATLYVTGISTFDGYTDINNSVDISANLNVVGLTTIGGFVDINDSVDVSNDVNVSGAATIGGFVDINNAVDISSNLNVGGISTFNNYGQFIDNASLYFGNGSDLNIYHDGSNSYIQEQGTGNLYIQSNGGSVNIRTNTSENAFVANQDGSVELYHNNNKKFETTSIGVAVSGIITATSGIVTYYGDGSYLTGNARNLTATIGIGTSGGVVGYAVSFIDLKGAGVSTAYYNSSVGIATIYFEGGGGGSANIGIGSTPGDAGFGVGVVTAGNLWYNTNIGRLFIYYQDTDSAQWVDAAPFNVGIITAVGSLSFANGTAITPSWYFDNSSTTGVFSPTAGQQTFVSVGSSILNINPAGIRVTGIVTSTSVSTGNINSSGIVTATDFDALSDINYKENVNTVNNALLKVDQLRGVKFDWKESGLPSYGVIAQELEEVLPELVHGNNPKTVNYNGIIGVLIEAIKELKAEVEELKNAK